MRHLKKFESMSKVDELKDFCQGYLAYLVDGGFGVKVLPSHHLYKVKIAILDDSKEYRNDYNLDWTFSWPKVQDHLVPFFQLLQKNYNIEFIIFKSFRYGNPYEENVSIYDLIEDKVDFKFLDIESIEIYISI